MSTVFARSHHRSDRVSSSAGTGEGVGVGGSGAAAGPRTFAIASAIVACISRTRRRVSSVARAVASPLSAPPEVLPASMARRARSRSGVAASRSRASTASSTRRSNSSAAAARAAAGHAGGAARPPYHAQRVAGRGHRGPWPRGVPVRRGPPDRDRQGGRSSGTSSSAHSGQLGAEAATAIGAAVGDEPVRTLALVAA